MFPLHASTYQFFYLRLQQKGKSSKRETAAVLPPFYLIYASMCVCLLHSEQSSVVLSP